MGVSQDPGTDFQRLKGLQMGQREMSISEPVGARQQERIESTKIMYEEKPFLLLSLKASVFCWSPETVYPTSLLHPFSFFLPPFFFLQLIDIVLHFLIFATREKMQCK